ncbi:glycosyltransferase family 92 protein RCOM_0530710-like [Papaver somniferum]|uniref:glycosyltransferase family 92 protein RCOM_0530710-like n=1 Tax=Papaver somniferum TaxID=3469 RepID=UPI000E6F52D4|nr:glycosyltransferase family 92 protein RCOM_0530710-like [Papaver somniferum]
MDIEKRRKRKLLVISTSSSPSSTSFLPSQFSFCVSLRWWSLLIFSFFAFLFLLDGPPFRSQYVLFHPHPGRSLSSSSAAVNSNSGFDFFKFNIEDRVVFPDHVLLLFTNRRSNHMYMNGGGLDCFYNKEFDKTQVVVLPALSVVDDFDGFRSIARCPLPPANYSTVVNLQRQDSLIEEDGNSEVKKRRLVSSWESVVYEAVLDGETAVVFVKGLGLRPGRTSDANQFVCNFNWGNSEVSDKYSVRTRAITAGQEVIRCALPFKLHQSPGKANGVRISIGVISHHPHSRASIRGENNHVHFLPSVARISQSKTEVEKKEEEKYELCVCTMVRNQASSMREWIKYHSWLGVERWFIYDNNSDDGIEELIDELNQENHNIRRQVWPWIKTQEAGFSHCALQAQKECKWVSFMDVDEFFYFPLPSARHPSDLGLPGRNSLRNLVANFSSSSTIGEIRTACHSFGPSGLTEIPKQGVTTGYTCRLQSPERHKSIVRPEVLDDSLINVVHHFHLKTGHRYLNLPMSTAMINHYKYQVWESFRAKFSRRVATYVADWQDSQNEGSRDRAPGLGTEAIEPPNWPQQFCQVWDTGLRDFVVANLADPDSGILPWEKSPPL